MPLPRFTTRHVLGRLARGGSSSPVVVETAGGRFVAKLRGAGGGVPALIAEIVAAELADRIGLPIPERALVELAPDFQSDDRNDELFDLLTRSVGLNLGFRWLDGARAPRPEELARFDAEFVARVLWLDGLTLNPDRTRANPNILFWKAQPWLIDHGAAFAFHYDWRQVTEDSPREPTSYTGHVFADRAALVASVDARLARRLDPHALRAALLAVPDELLAAATPEAPARARAAYEAFLWKRLKAPRPFVPVSPAT
jgi:hypothetical protein